MSRPTRLAQTLLDGRLRVLNQGIPTFTFTELSVLNSDLFDTFDHARPIGVTPGYSAEGKLVALAFADDAACRIIEFDQPKPRGHRRADRPFTPTQDHLNARQAIQDRLLCREAGEIYAFDMGPLCLSLYCDVGIRVTNAVDIQSAFSAFKRKPIEAIEATVGTTLKINAENVRTVFGDPIYDETMKNRQTDLAMRAWVSQFLVTYQNGQETFAKVPRIDTKKLDAHRLDMIAKIASDSLRLDQRKATTTSHRIQGGYDRNVDQLSLTSQAFSNRVRRGQNVRLTVQGETGQYRFKGKMAEVEGRVGNVASDLTGLANKAVVSVISIGRDDPTTADAHRAATILRILQGTADLLDSSPWIQNIWFPQNEEGLLIWPEEWSNVPPLRAPPQGNLVRHNLNASQRGAVNAMVSMHNNHRLVIIQGPPGTGKTSVIAQYVKLALSLGCSGIWLVAKTNVAVKNIGEKLLDVDFTEWRILVSKDFRFDWHEHIYHKVEEYVIQSDELVLPETQSRFAGIKVMLCTIAMLSNSQLFRVTSRIPVKTLIVDEASQIEIGDYIPVFSKFQNTLRKACFIGDDKQLPPYGQEDLKDLQSIFEITHLQKHVRFLNIQYRMPPQIGDIISDAAYDTKLKSNPLHPVTEETTACFFIDVPGRERPQEGGSCRNDEECAVILQLAQKLQVLNAEYKIITPYEGQRSLIEKSMQTTEGLNWEDKCFNVDSFQGNEEDFIIISVVRSRQIGFLNNLRRTNVMLTRCRKGMFIVSSRQFLFGPGKETLVGHLATKVAPDAWLTSADVGKDGWLTLS